MIQRIQSIYLFLAIDLMILTFFLPVWQWNVAGAAPATYSLYNYGIDTQQVGFSSPFLYSALLCCLSVCSVFLYGWALLSFKNLKKAVTLLVLSLISTLLYGGSLGLIVYDMNTTHGLSGNIPQLGTLFPIIAFVFGILAFRAIRRDQALLRSADRIR